MGGEGRFRRALTRAPLESDPWSRARGPHKGIQPANVPWEIYAACSDGENINVATYIALHTTIDLDGLYDILEMQAVHASWCAAAYRNAKDGGA